MRDWPLPSIALEIKGLLHDIGADLLKTRTPPEREPHTDF
ncbi:hypothetical protein SAMN06265347_104104 [Halobellus salinus]|nr:hypothetical protein SAMN06265347_104104 [Halobellus salinus]